MTYEEAIKVLRVILDPYDYPFGEKSKCYQYDLEAINKAIEALEKQIPKKPIERFMLSYDIDAGVCPLCNVGVHEEMNFCSYCGQAIDWSEQSD